MTIKTFNSKQTYVLAAKLASKLKGGDVIALSGNLGAGKTTFVKGLAKALGIKQHITSPTFLLLKSYPVRQSVKNKKDGIQQFVHVDAYRIERVDDLREIGFFEYAGQAGTVTLVEWAERVRAAIPKKSIWIKIKIGQSADRPTERTFTIQGVKNWK